MQIGGHKRLQLTTLVASCKQLGLNFNKVCVCVFSALDDIELEKCALSGWKEDLKAGL